MDKIMILKDQKNILYNGKIKRSCHTNASQQSSVFSLNEEDCGYMFWNVFKFYIPTIFFIERKDGGPGRGSKESSAECSLDPPLSIFLFSRFFVFLESEKVSKKNFSKFTKRKL
jgi:hypothetical protein